MESRECVLSLFREHESYTNKRVKEGIETYRKGDFCIDVCDKSGNPVENAEIFVSQTGHDFKFGANMFLLDQMESEEKNNLYKKKFKNTFNMATLPFYWPATEPEENVYRYDKNSPPMYRRPPIDTCLEFCEENGIEPREHSLCYRTPFPYWLTNKSSFEIRKALKKRIWQIAERYAHRVPTIEITNEMFWDLDGICFYNEDDYVEWCFKEVEKAMPNNKLVINEHAQMWYMGNGTNRDRFYMQIERLLDKGVRIDAIGSQFHMFNRYEEEYEFTRKTYNPEFIYRVFDKYDDFHRPWQMSEITIPAYSESAFDEDIQAEILKNLYSIWFGYKNMEQIVYWNFVDGYAAGKLGDMTSGENRFHGGMLRFDLSEKPSFKVINNLINNEWKTKENIVTNADGKASFRGFYGKYDIKVKAGSQTVVKQVDFPKNTDGSAKIIL